MWRYEILAALAVGAAVIAISSIAEAGDKSGSSGNRSSGRSGSNSQSRSFQSEMNKSSHGDHHGHHGNGNGNGHHDHHADHHHHHHDYYPTRVRYVPQPYPVAVPVPVAAPVVPTIQQGGANLVEGVNLQLVDVRMVDAGDASRKLGPRFRVVIGNRGTQAAGNFQVIAVASKETTLTADLPHSMAEVEGVAAGQVAKVDVRLPIGAMTMIDGNPFNVLAVMVDAKKLVDETAEKDNFGMMDREKIEMLESAPK